MTALSFPPLRGLLVAAAFAPVALAQTTSNPFPGSIPQGSLAVSVSSFATIPSIRGQTPRLHQLLTAPDGRIFVVDQLGPIYVVSADGSTVTRYLDLGTQAGISLINSGEQGFESLAFHPDFLKVGSAGYGKFYTAHTSSNTSPAADFTPGGGGNADDNVVLEWTTAHPEASTFTPANSAAPYRELLRVEAPYSNHTIGLVAFNPTVASGAADYGKLYVSLGDGGSGGDPLHLAQNRAKAHGKILRIDPLGSNSTNGKYGIPSDNPFVGVSGTAPEIWALGLRNPQRYVWDSAGAHRMFIADIGQGTVEEIDLGSPGANYGWSQREGSFVYNDTGSVGSNARADAASTGFTYPIAEYDHDEGVSITTGPVYRSSAIPALDGKLIFGDIARGRVFLINADAPPNGGQSPITELRLRFDGVQRSLLEQIQVGDPSASRVDLRFGRDLSGRVFLLNKQDGIVRLITPNNKPVVHLTGKETRVVSSRAVRVHGRATSSAGISAVKYRLNHGSFHNAHGHTRWNFTARGLKSGRNKITIRAVDKTGIVSLSKKLIVVRR